jgi:hypothetical protein
MGMYLQIHGTKEQGRKGKTDALLQQEPGAREVLYAEVMVNRQACIQPDEVLILVVTNPAFDACLIMDHHEWNVLQRDWNDPSDTRPMRYIAIKKASARIPEAIRKELP